MSRQLRRGMESGSTSHPSGLVVTWYDYGRPQFALSQIPEAKVGGEGRENETDTEPSPRKLKDTPFFKKGPLA